MLPADLENQKMLRRLSRQVALAVWISSACLATLLLVLLFPRQAEFISQTSVSIQDWLAPHMAGILGLATALIVVIITAAFVASHFSPKAPAEIERINGKDQF